MIVKLVDLWSCLYWLLIVWRLVCQAVNFCYVICVFWKGLCHHHTHVSDGETPIVSSGAIGHRFTPPTSSRSSQLSQSNVGVYGYMYRAPVFSAPQRSLESPRACDVLLDFDRLKTCDVKATEAQKGLDLMSRSYHSHYQSACLFQPDLSPSDAEKLLDASRRCGSSSYGNMSEVVAGQVVRTLYDLIWLLQYFPRICCWF